MTGRLLVVLGLCLGMMAWSADDAKSADSFKVKKSDAEWKKELSPDAYKVLRHEGTERSFTGKYWNDKRPGTYHCAGCGEKLFDAKTKYKSGTGWPSFWQPIDKNAVGLKVDRKFFSTRTEVHCASCGGHLGYVFDDGPEPTGKRYCMNSVSLIHSADKNKAADKGKGEPSKVDKGSSKGSSKR